MKTSLWNAFALVHLFLVIEFHLSQENIHHPICSYSLSVPWLNVSPSSSHIPRSSHQSPNRSISLSSLSLSVRVCHHSLFPTVSIVAKATRVPSATILHTIKTISTNTTTTDFLSLAMCSILTRHQTPLLSYANISIILFYLPLSSYFVQSIPSSSSLSSIQAQSPNCTTCPVLSSCLPNHA